MHTGRREIEVDGGEYPAGSVGLAEAGGAVDNWLIGCGRTTMGGIAQFAGKCGSRAIPSRQSSRANSAVEVDSAFIAASTFLRSAAG